MPYTLYVHSHPLGVVVCNQSQERELLIDGESCCGVGFDELKRIASTTGQVELEEALAPVCRLRQSIVRAG
jgi:hypothetical protein